MMEKGIEKEGVPVTRLPAKVARGLARRAAGRASGIAQAAAPMLGGSVDPVARPALWSFAVVEEWLIEAVRAWWRHDRSGGRSPFASDGPWNLIVAEWGDWGAHDRDDAEPGQPGLSRAQIGRMQEATEWLLIVPEGDRRVLCLALRQLAMGRDEPDWKRMLRPLGLRRGAGALKRRYAQGIMAICTRLNGAVLVAGGVERAA